LTGGVIALVLAPVLGLTLLALVTLTLPRGPTGLRLVFLALLHLVLSARALSGGLLAFAVTSGGTLLALALALLGVGLVLTLLRLPSCRVALRLALFALLLGATLRLAGLASLVARSGGAPLHLCAAMRRRAG
jgi:hypothetical protein